jgi:hypothetical protein
MSTSLRRGQLIAGLATLISAASASGAGAQGLRIPGLPTDSAQQAPPPPPVQPGKQSLSPAGYSLRYADIRNLLALGDFDAALSQFQALGSNAQGPAAGTPPANAAAEDAESQQRPLFTSSDVFLSNSEIGLMHYEARRNSDAQTHLEAARGATEESQSRVGGALRWVRDRARQATATVLGRGDFGPYRKRDYEGILQLNYLAMNFLIQGDRRSYNVARASANEQLQLQARFAERIARAQTELEEKRSENAQQTDSVMDTLTPEFNAFAPVANRVPSAYVNPFGPYVSGMVLEIASLEQEALRGNARGAYEEALGLQPRSAQLAGAVEAMRNNHTPGTRVLHLIVGEGFAPSRHVLRYGLQLDDGTVLPLRMGMFVPEASQAARVELTYAGAPRPVTLEPISDVEALVLRDQNDRLLFMWLDLLVAAYRDRQTQVIEQSLNQLTGGGLSLASVPDLRSWCSLPRRMHVARVVLPASATQATITVRNGGGGVVRRGSVTLDPNNQQTLIYARATDSVLRVDQSRRLWVDGGVDLSASQGSN